MQESSPDNPTDDRPTRPLVVDLDGTLVATDTLQEQVLELVGKNPLGLPEALAALLGGRVRFKSALARLVPVDATALPYRDGDGDSVLALIQREKDAGRPIVLATASHRSTAEAVAEHLGVFDAVIATDDGGPNLKGTGKLEAIKTLLAERGWGEDFDYAGDSKADLPIWAESTVAVTVDIDPRAVDRIQTKQDKLNLSQDKGSALGQLLGLVRAGRPHQWCKNPLLAVPFLAGQRGGELLAWGEFLIAFFAFSFCASAVYLVNDLLDLRADRLHPTKRNRPFAAGKVPVAMGVVAAPLLVVVASVLAVALLPIGFLWAMLVYTAAAWVYSIAVKRKAILDVVWLAGLYSVRVIAGGLATATPVSEWLLALVLFMFLSIALAKRYAELRLLGAEGRTEAEGRRYRVDDAPLLSVMGMGSGMIGVLIMALYINSDKVTKLYSTPEVLWIVCPIMLYWIGRLWMRAHRRMMKDDPLLFALTDRVSYIVALLVILAAMIAA